MHAYDPVAPARPDGKLQSRRAMTHFSNIKTSNVIKKPEPRCLSKMALGNAPGTLLYVPGPHNVQDEAPAK
jgi:hypothetical protein